MSLVDSTVAPGADSDEFSRLVSLALIQREKDAPELHRLHKYVEGKAGVPELEAGAHGELRELARQSPINMLGVIVSTFDAGLSVVGFRSPREADNDPSWDLWQASGMDARQTEVHRAALTYGWSFVSVLPDDTEGGQPRFAAWSPLDATAVYDDPRRDLFPRLALLTRSVQHPEYGKGHSVLIIDETTVTPAFIRGGNTFEPETLDSLIIDGEPWEHGAVYGGQPVCPVVRFVNTREAEDGNPHGEVEPLIVKQNALNSVNFDRLVNSRFNAFQQTVIIGWMGSPDETARMSAAKAIAFPDHPDDVKVNKLPASPLDPYNALIREMKEEFALEASIPLYTATGSISNVSTDTAAMVEGAHQRKLRRKRDSFGESWEQVLRLAVGMAGGAEPSVQAEVIWRETEARSFAAVVDGITKLASLPNGGVPITDLLDLIPGMTQQKIASIAEGVRLQRGRDALATVASIADQHRAQPATPSLEPGSLPELPSTADMVEVLMGE